MGGQRLSLATENRNDSFAVCLPLVSPLARSIQSKNCAWPTKTSPKIQKTIHAIRQCLKTRDYRQLDAELVDAWLNMVEAKQLIEAVGNELKSRLPSL